MFEVLVRAEALLRDPTSSPLLNPDLWSTLDIDYEPPRVERLWCQFDPDEGVFGSGIYRLNLHCIHPCADGEALFHVHGWASAIKIHWVPGGVGAYQMGMGHTLDKMAPTEAGTMILAPGSSYEMVDEDGWHYVRPIGGVSYSTMVTGPPWGRRGPAPTRTLNPLLPERKPELLKVFRGIYKLP